LLDYSLLGYSEDLALTLLMARVIAHHVDHAAAADELAILTNSFDAGANFHGNSTLFLTL